MKEFKDILAESGAGLWGTDKLRKKLQKDTPGQPIETFDINKEFDKFVEAGSCWDGYKQVGMKKKGDKMVPNCVPEEVTEAADRSAISAALRKAAEKENLKSKRDVERFFDYSGGDIIFKMVKDEDEANGLISQFKSQYKQKFKEGYDRVTDIDIEQGKRDLKKKKIDKAIKDVGEGREVYIVKKGPYTRKVDGATADRMKKDGWSIAGRETVSEGSESWEDGYERRVVKTTKPEHKEQGYNWRIKGKDKAHLTIKLYKNKPSQTEFNKQMKRVAGHEFGG